MEAHTPYGSTMKAQWNCESAMEALCFRGNTMEEPWKHYRIPLKVHGSTVGVHTNFMEAAGRNYRRHLGYTSIAE